MGSLLSRDAGESGYPGLNAQNAALTLLRLRGSDDTAVGFGYDIRQFMQRGSAEINSLFRRVGNCVASY